MASSVSHINRFGSETSELKYWKKLQTQNKKCNLHANMQTATDQKVTKTNETLNLKREL